MNVYVFAIGGTGARVLRSLSFCLASGMECIPDGTHIIPMIIDYDRSNGDKERCIKNLETYTRIRKEAYDGVNPEGDERNFFMPSIDYLSNVGALEGREDVHIAPSFEFQFGLGETTNTGTFADYMDYAQMMGSATSLTKDLLSSLYNDEDPSSSLTELNLDLSVGFKGNPNIGSVIFENIKDDAEFRRFKCSFDPTRDRIFIISSIFGGTGSSGFPRVVDAIRYSGIAGYEDALLGAAVVMPYFKVNTPRGGAIYSNIFNSKQKAALSYYGKKDDHNKSLFDKVTTSYFIGDDDATTLPYSEGTSTQMNDAHFVELLAALAIVDFISTPKSKLLGQKQKEYGLPKTPADTECIQLNHLKGEDKKKYFDFIARMALAFRYYEEEVLTDTIKEKEAYYKGLGLADKVGTEGMYEDLESYIEDFNNWLDEMSVQKDAFKPFLHVPRNENSDAPIADNLGDYIAGYEAAEGGVFSSGASYKDFSAFCSKGYDKYGQYIDNEEYALLALYYDAAAQTLDYYDKIN